MTDIIKDAKQLLEGATPGPWEWIGYDLEQTFDAGSAIVMEATCENPHLGGVVNVEITPEDERLIAAAPELAQALAEETYFYGVQVWIGGRWIMMLTRDHGTSITHRGKWFEHKHEAQECAATWNHDTPTRIVRQRRSTVEVIND